MTHHPFIHSLNEAKPHQFSTDVEIEDVETLSLSVARYFTFHSCPKHTHARQGIRIIPTAFIHVSREFPDTDLSHGRYMRRTLLSGKDYWVCSLYTWLAMLGGVTGEACVTYTVNSTAAHAVDFAVDVTCFLPNMYSSYVN
ncbi:hypothetical protein WUBG_02291 [Wuchereria bancrofti]|uniref:Uncharacterized protein n=1 Tax=Wuchereria bancrofti TaxID=6293 RepID=J9FHH3_WUCBA|nr:hypothetical protein WUBG_02291 [Wuchereria bancrofti]